mmetsp:Transcript_78326/g.254445  ORF Transcript_78326/g.254445 Transcript_78326/m.254445 type:complete len:219 (-) Transcript_78326:5980-6636(-)
MHCIFILATFESGCLRLVNGRLQLLDFTRINGYCQVLPRTSFPAFFFEDCPGGAEFLGGKASFGSLSNSYLEICDPTASHRSIQGLLGSSLDSRHFFQFRQSLPGILDLNINKASRVRFTDRGPQLSRISAGTGMRQVAACQLLLQGFSSLCELLDFKLRSPRFINGGLQLFDIPSEDSAGQGLPGTRFSALLIEDALSDANILCWQSVCSGLHDSLA